MNNLEKSIKKTKIFFFLFVFVQGIFYVFLIPPWQSPDETHHFGYGALLSKNIKLSPKSYKNIDKKIIDSMATFHAWKYQNIPRPYPLPNKYSKVMFFGGSSGLVTLSRRAPLYYIMSSFIIRKTQISRILSQFYLIRGFSFILFLFTIYFTYLSSKILFKDNLIYCLATVSFVALLPQFLIISTSVNPINLAILLETILIYLVLLFLYKEKKLLIVLLAPIIITFGLFNHRSALFMIPPFLVLLLIYLVSSLKNRKKLLKFFIIFIAIIIIFFTLYFIARYLFPDYLNKVHITSVIRTRLDLNFFIKSLSTPSSRTLSVFLDGFFKSFLFFAGWLRFGYLVDIYSIFKLICLLSFLGLIKYMVSILTTKNYKTVIDFKSFLILVVALLSIIGGTIIHSFPTHYVAQGRYIFPAISAIAILFVLGLKEITPKRFENWVPIFIIIGFIILDIYTLFHALIRVFYYFTNA